MAAPEGKAYPSTPYICRKRNSEAVPIPTFGVWNLAAMVGTVARVMGAVATEAPLRRSSRRGPPIRRSVAPRAAALGVGGKQRCSRRGEPAPRPTGMTVRPAPNWLRSLAAS